MTYYYETAPLPTALAWYAHHLPVWWHHLESRATLVLELAVPLAFFGPRPARLASAVALTLFQLVNAATANYGFFCYIAAALHLFLLDDGALERLAARLPRRDGPLPWPPGLRAAVRKYLAPAGVAAWVSLSLLNAAVHFGDGGPWMLAFEGVRARTEPLRLVNTYHLFASITRERIEPEPEIEPAIGAPWLGLELWHKPGDPTRRPDYVAPHQPRVDFQLWFHGLSFQSRQPLYVASLLRHLCDDRPAVQPLFRQPLPGAVAVRMAYYRYNFASRAERRATGRWWNRTLLGTTAPIPCDR
jgi:lipase maturation factor 1